MLEKIAEDSSRIRTYNMELVGVRAALLANAEDLRGHNLEQGSQCLYL